MTVLYVAGDVAVCLVFGYLMIVYALVLNPWAPWNELLCSCTPADRAEQYIEAREQARATDRVQLSHGCGLPGHRIRVVFPPPPLRPITITRPTQEGS